MKELKWPKQLPALSSEQQRISDEFMNAWLNELRSRYSAIERFNHGFAIRVSGADFTTTLEIGAGLGEHIQHEELTEAQRASYFAVDIRQNMIAALRSSFPWVHAILADCQAPMPFPTDFFDRILAIHVLEHLPNLPATVAELFRLCSKSKGRLVAVIPCEGGPAYAIARKISAERFYKKHFGRSYKWLHTREHVNTPHEIVGELRKFFRVETVEFFPLKWLPLTTVNLCLGMALTPRLDIEPLRVDELIFSDFVRLKKSEARM